MPIPEIDLTVYPDECDAFGHLNQASFLTLFERARWEMLKLGPGMDVFTRTETWPVVRRAEIDYHAAAFPGDILRFQQDLTHHGRTSFTMRQTARRLKDEVLIATGEFVFVCVDRTGRPVPVPPEFSEFMAPPQEREREAGRFTVNGVGLAVEVRGEGPAILFVHGYPLDRTIWASQLEGLAGLRRIAPDLRGMGRSDAPAAGYSMETYAADLVALLDVLDVEQAILCGHSMGGYVAFELLRRWPHRVRGLILVSTRAEGDTPEQKRGRDLAAATARERGAVAIADAMLPKMLAPGAPAETPAAGRIHRVMAATPVAGIVGALSAMRDRDDSTALLPAIAVPTLVLVGDLDRLTPPDGAHRMAAAIPGARVVVIPGAGHLPPVEAPGMVTRLVGEFAGSMG
jgi:3-oxoadipate enol-lactonase